MRNFNQPVAAVLASMASFLGGNALAPSVAAAATSTPQVFEACAKVATQQELVIQTNQTITTDTGFDWDVTVPKGTTGRANFKLTSEQGGPVITPAGDSCDGVVTDKATMYLKSGSSTETVPGAGTELTFTADDVNEQVPLESTDEGSFSYRRLCRIAKRHARNTVRLDLLKTMTYTEPGYPTFEGRNDYSREFINGPFYPDPSLGLPCSHNKAGYNFDVNNPATMGVVATPPGL
jgi:hypothetical protein